MLDIIAKILLGLAASIIVYTLVVDYLDIKKAKEIAAQKAQAKQLSKAIIENIKRGNVNTVYIGLYDYQNKKQANIEIEAKSLSSEIYKGLTLFS